MKIRIGNDFRYNWLILWNEEAESFTDVTDKRLTVTVYGRVTELVEGTDYTITGNAIAIDFTPAICDKTGSYNLALQYTKPSDKFIDGDRRSAVDVDAFIIVPKSEQSDSLEDITHTSDAVATFLDVAYKKLDEIEAAEAVREVAEDGRVTAETGRVTAEGLRATAETSRAGAETGRVTSEGLRASAETSRAGAETVRSDNETGRVTAEGLRATAETSRAGAETNRVTAEGVRVTAETGRVTAETGRATAEGVRVTNEAGRVAAEVLREANIQDAIDAATYANEQGAYAEEMSAHPPVIIADYWHNWNFTTNQYESTGQYARGDSAVEGALVVQETGQSAVNTMSQKAITDELVQLAGEMNLDIIKTTDNTSLIWGECIDELYIKREAIGQATEEVLLMSLNSSIYVRGVTASVSSTTYTWWAFTNISEYGNGDVIPIICNLSGDGVYIGDIVGYVVFKDISTFINSTSSAPDKYLSLPNVTDLFKHTEIAKSIVAPSSLNSEVQIIKDNLNIVENNLNVIVKNEIDEELSSRTLTFIPDQATLSDLYDSSSFSGHGQFIGEVGAFRYLFTKIRCAAWSGNITPVTKVLVQFRQGTREGALLFEKLFDIKPILPGEISDVILDFEDSINLTGDIFMCVRMNALSTMQKASSTNSIYTVPGVYFTSGNITSSNTGGTGAGFTNSNLFWILYDVINTTLNFTEESVDKINSIIEVPTDTVDVILPDTLYAIVGDTLQLFYRGMIKSPNPYIYNILVTCGVGEQYPRYFEYSPTVEDIGTTTFKVEVKDKDGNILGGKTCNLVTKAAVQAPATDKKVLCVGDSLTSAGTWCIEASRRLIGTGGTPIGLGLTNISFLGRRTGSGIGWEGNGGWHWDSYSTVGREAYKFYISGVATAPSMGATYTNNGVTYTISEINITAGTGYVSATGTGAPTASGTLTKVTGGGDVTLTFSSSEADSGNPFWESDTNLLDFPQYVNTYMNGGCDVIYFLLSWNAQPPHRTDFTLVINSAKVLVDHIHTNYPNCKMKIMGIQVPSLNGGMGANYGATGIGYADTYGMVVTALNMNKAYQDWCNEAAYSSFLEFVNVSAQFDSENNMPEVDTLVNLRSDKTEKLGTNGVHPATSGYYQIGDVVFRNFVANFCQ